jgi:hypothetical protein
MSEHDPRTAKIVSRPSASPRHGAEPSTVSILLPLALVIVGTFSWYAMNEEPSPAVVSAAHEEAAPHVEVAVTPEPEPEPEGEPEPVAAPAALPTAKTSRTKSNLPATRTPEVRETQPETREVDGEEVDTEAESAPRPVVALNAELVVKHKHRIGSCEGVLRLSADALQYESSHKDAFSVALSDVERFSRDGETLRVKVRDGRNYNFIERDDDRAALASFHDRAAPALASKD